MSIKITEAIDIVESILDDTAPGSDNTCEIRAFFTIDASELPTAIRTDKIFVGVYGRLDG